MTAWAIAGTALVWAVLIVVAFGLYVEFMVWLGTKLHEAMERDTRAPNDPDVIPINNSADKPRPAA